MITWDDAAGQYIEYIESLFNIGHYGSLFQNTVKISECLNFLSDQIFQKENIVPYSEVDSNYRNQKVWIYMGVRAFGCMKTLLPSLTSHDIQELLVSKQRDYGTHNISRFGIVGIIIRLNDKIARLFNLLEKSTDTNHSTVAVKDEPLYQTYMDVVGYCVVAMMFLTKVKNSNFENEISQFYLPLSDPQWQKV